MIGPPDPSLVVLVLVAASLSVVVSKRTCPAEEETMPCKCSSRSGGGVDVTCEKVSAESIMRALRAVVPTSQTIVYLRLRHCNVTEMPGDMFDKLEVKFLIALNNSISSVHKNAFAPLASSLEIMELMQNRLAEIPVEALLPLRTLVTLALSYNKIEELPARAFSGLKGLQTLKINDNKISKIDENAFEGIQSTLTQLYLASNHLTSVPVNALRILNRLSHLELKHNRIGNISKEDFQDLTALDYLGLSNNLIETLPSQLFSNRTVLNSLNLEANMIETISNDAFIEVTDTLEWLKLGENRLNKIPVEALRPLDRLRELELWHNNISVIPENAFESFSTNLKSLNLNKNNIKHIPPLIFSTMHNLQWLHLSDNQLQRIPMEIYQPILGKLKSVDLHNNPLICDCDMLWFREWLNTSNGSKLLFADDTRCHEPSSLRSQILRQIPNVHFTCPMYQSSDSSLKISISWSLLLMVFTSLCFI